MIQRLIDTLQVLAASPEVQLARVPGFVVKADELALDFDDALRLVRDCPQLLLTGQQRNALAEMDAAVAAVTGQQHAELRTEEAVRTSPAWATVRQRARAALSVLDAPLIPMA